MKRSARHSIEPLEARIAPARLIDAGVPNGVPGGSTDTDYKDTDPVHDSYFIDTEEFPNDLKISTQLGPGVENLADTFFIRMSAGDLLQLHNSTNGLVPFLQVTSGNIIAMFEDKNLDNEVDELELTGIALGKGAKIILNGTVEGDIVANLNELGTKSTADDQLEFSGLVSNKQSIGSVEVKAGSVGGSIIAGGSISNIEVAGTVTSVLAGSAANGKSFDFYPSAPFGDGILSVNPAAGEAGPSITDVRVNGLGTPGSADPFNGLLQAGGGGAGGKGGSVTLVRVTLDSDGMTIRGGVGGDSGANKPNGGAGGAVSRIFVGGFPDTTTDIVSIAGGAGGDSLSGKGGAGGALKDIFVGYRLFGTTPFPTTDLLIDRILIDGGAGGDGKRGGQGGSITHADVRVLTPGGTGDEIAIVGGAGGASVQSGGKAGAGGSLLNIVARNQDRVGGSTSPETLIQGGLGGTGGPQSTGGNGGNVTDVTLLGWRLRVAAGNAGEGKVGGNGGTLTNLLAEENDDIVTQSVQIDAGAGGNGLVGNGGKGGNINRVLIEDSDLTDFVINGGGAADGGDSVGGKGGIGGSVLAVEIRDNNLSNGAIQTPLMTVRTGSGGDGTKGGGAGGSLKTFNLESTNVNAALFTGDGGNVTGSGAKGKGGAGGSFENVGIIVRDFVGDVPAFATAIAGNGGAGAGANGTGGAGGDVRTVTLTSIGEGILRAGNGGDGQVNSGTIKGGAAGRGGNIIVSQLRVATGDGELVAGDAGVNGAKGGAGGSILGQNTDLRTSLFANNNLLMSAGDGSHGGAGGSIRFVGYGSASLTSATPAGNITIQAGHGSAEGKKAGAGGSIQDLSGALPSADPSQTDESFTLSITAGNGGGSSSKGAAGGSVQDIVILGGGFDGAIMTVQAGDAGDSSGAPNGAKGGDVKNVTVSPDVTGMDTVFRSVAAGNGGDAVRKGGTGGSVLGVFVDGLDIGDRGDVPFGFMQMGGVFAGEGGSGLRPGANGKVITIVAEGIAAIVAGRDSTPAPAEFVDDIILTGNNSLHREKNVFVEPGPFRLAYTVDADAAVVTEGGEANQEVQELVLSVLQSANAQITLTYGDQSTGPLSGNASAAEIQAALNGLDSIKATGPENTGSVTVVPFTKDNEPGTGAAGPGFLITFNNSGNQVGVISLDATATTGLFPVDATAGQVQTALNALPTIQYLGAELEEPVAGSVIVEGGNGSFEVQFQQSGNIAPLEGIEVFNATLTELTQGSIDRDISTQLVPGATNLTVDELQSGQQPFTVEIVAPGSAGTPERQGISLTDVLGIPGAQMQFSFTGSLVSTEAAGGDAATREVQNINLAAVRGDNSSTFTLSFNGGTTAPIPFNATADQIRAALNAVPQISQIGGVSVLPAGVNALIQIQFAQNGARNAITGEVTSTTSMLPVTATEAQIETAMNAMASVQVTDPDLVSGAIDVVVGANDSVFFDFLENGDQQTIIANAFMPEIQELDRSTLEADPTGTFTLSFARNYTPVVFNGGSGVRERQEITMGTVLGNPDSTFTISYNNRTTIPLRGNATASEIEAAIENPTTGLGVPVQTPGIVGGKLVLQFTGFGDQPFQFSVDAVSQSTALLADSTPLEVQNALNGLPTIKGPSGTESVLVTAQADNDYEVTFQTNGQRAPITVSVTGNEVQGVNVSPILDDATGSFRLGFEGEFTPELLASATPDEVRTALNALASIQAAGNVTVTAGAETGTYEVRFGNPGDKTELDVQLEVDEIQNVDVVPGKPFILTVEHDVVASEVVQGDPAVQEVQVLSMGPILGSASEFTLSYNPGNGAQTTAVLLGTATAEQIQAALEALPAIGVGGVTVDIDGSLIQITFALNENQPGLISAHATQSTPELAPDVTAPQIQTALNSLATVQAKGAGSDPGNVQVALGTGSNFTVRFGSGGDQLMVIATQEQPLQVFTEREGGQVLTEIQDFSPQAKGQPTEDAYAEANLIGFYADHTEIDANIFHFLHNGVLMTSKTGEFVEGDEPIDGLVFAKKWNPARIWGTPEAYLVGDVFYDWDNKI